MILSREAVGGPGGDGVLKPRRALRDGFAALALAWGRRDFGIAVPLALCAEGREPRFRNRDKHWGKARWAGSAALALAWGRRDFGIAVPFALRAERGAKNAMIRNGLRRFGLFYF